MDSDFKEKFIDLATKDFIGLINDFTNFIVIFAI